MTTDLHKIELGEAVKAARLAQGLDIDEAAGLVRFAKYEIARIESGTFDDYELLFRYARAIGVDILFSTVDRRPRCRAMLSLAPNWNWPCVLLDEHSGDHRNGIDERWS